MAKKKISKSFNGPVMVFDGTGAYANLLNSEGYQKFSNFINSDAFQGYSKGIGAFNTAYNNGDGAFLEANRSTAHSGKLGSIGSAIDTLGQTFTAIDSLLTKKRKPMEKTVGLYADGGHLFSGGGAAISGAMGGAGGGGGGMGASDYMNMGTTALALVGNAIQNAKIEDTTNLEEGINNATAKGQRKDDTFDALLNDYATTHELGHISYRDLRNRSSFGDWANSLSASAQGFSAGSSAGTAGAIIGGVFGGVSSAIGSLVGRHKAKKKARQINEKIDAVNAFNQNSLVNRLENLQEKQNLEAIAKYKAFGGPLDFEIYPISGAIDYEMAQRRLAQKDLELKKAFGGPLHSNGSDWTNGIVIIGNGGSHESNPFEGVPMGVAPDGKPNLVEEGEVIFDDYVYSNRIKVPESVKDKYKLKGKKDMTFADAAKKAQEESEERPNDPISKRGLEDIMNKLMVEQEAIREKREQRKLRRYAEGGGIHIAPSKRGTFTAAAAKHDMGVQEFASKVLANKEDYSPAMVKKANFAKNASKWKHAYGGIMGHHFVGTGPDSQSLVMLPGYSSLADYPWIIDTATEEKKEVTPMQQIAADKTAQRTDGRKVVVTDQGTNFKLDTPITDNDIEVVEGVSGGGKKKKGNWLTGLRYVPAIGAGLGVFSDLMGWTNQPDYTDADLMLAAANAVGNVTPKPIGDYMRYVPLDRLFYANQLQANAAATRRNILNTSGLNRGAATAGLLAADYNAQAQLGNLYRQAEEYNLGQRERVATFNRSTNMFNSENDLKAQIASRESDKIRLDAAIRAAALRNDARARASAARSANLTNFFNSLGDIGREEVAKSWINENPALRYGISTGGSGVNYKALGYKYNPETGERIAAKGGYLTIKSKKRRK